MEVDIKDIAVPVGSAVGAAIAAVFGKAKLDQRSGNDYGGLKSEVKAHADLDSERWEKIERHMEGQGKTLNDVDKRLARLEGRFEERDNQKR